MPGGWRGDVRRVTVVYDLASLKKFVLFLYCKSKRRERKKTRYFDYAAV